MSLRAELDEAAALGPFSGVVRVERDGEIEVEQAYGLRDRAHDLPVRPDTQFGLASGTKGLTALTVMSLVADGHLKLETPARTVLGTELPLIDDRVTIEQLLSHRAGIGDYLDEDSDEYDMNSYLMPVPVHALATTSDYLTVLDGHPQVTVPGATFSYNNGAFVVLALLAERVAGQSFPDLVVERVCDPAGLSDTRFLRSDELPGRAAVGYLGIDTDQTNVLHLPVRGSGDGGIFSTANDISALWSALFGGRILPEAYVADIVRARYDAVADSLGYGLGLWLHAGSRRVELHGYDTGVSFRSVHDPGTASTWTVISNTTEASRPIEEVLDRAIG